MRERYKYVLVDFYEGDVQIVGARPTRAELRKLYNSWWSDTDGECDVRGFDITTREKRKEFKKYMRYMKEFWD